jgi:hypothetical protein
MKATRLNEIKELAEKGEVSHKEVIEICSETILSLSKHMNDLKSIIKNLEDKVNKMESKISFLYDNNSPIYSAVLEDYEQE